jgi:hypothetical protein
MVARWCIARRVRPMLSGRGTKAEWEGETGHWRVSANEPASDVIYTYQPLVVVELVERRSLYR